MTGFSLSISVFPCQHLPANGPYSSFLLKATLIRGINGRSLETFEENQRSFIYEGFSVLQVIQSYARSMDLRADRFRGKVCPFL